MKRWPSLVLMFIAAALVRCVLFVDDSATGTSCRFSGDQTAACGECIAAHCQAAVNACCTDPGCAAHLDTLDECASGKSCNGLVLAPALASCVSTSCPACQTPDGGFPDASATTLQSSCDTFGDDGCRCTGAGTPNEMRCDTTTVTAAVCCADANYPAKNNYCTCEVFVCGAQSSSGSCAPTITDTGTHSWSGSGCCNGAELCLCDSVFTSCPTDNTPVAACTADVARCGVGQKKVTSCSF